MSNQEENRNITIVSYRKEYVPEYIYPERVIHCGKSNQKAEVQRLNKVRKQDI